MDPETRDPKPARNRKPGTPNDEPPKFETRDMDPKPETRNPQPEIEDSKLPKPATRNSTPGARAALWQDAAPIAPHLFNESLLLAKTSNMAPTEVIGGYQICDSVGYETCDYRLFNLCIYPGARAALWQDAAPAAPRLCPLPGRAP